jgi:hypothetical protein
VAAERGWQREFDDPIPLPSSGRMKTLEDAARFIQKLSKAEQQRAHWQLAVETLINCAEGRDLLFHTRIAVVCTENLNPNVLTMKSARYGARIYDAGSLNLARDRRIFVQ